MPGPNGDASWALQLEPLDAELRHQPYGWLYRSPLPRTKSTSPYPTMRVSGSVVMGGRELTVDGWRGMLGHNWGAEHAPLDVAAWRRLHGGARGSPVAG